MTGYAAHPDLSANCFLNNLISAVEIRSDGTHLNRLIVIQRRAFDTFL